MHYRFKSCGINGNFERNGFSDLDRLALHIMYPEDNHVAEFVGTTVIRAGETLHLKSAWKVRGANMNYAAKDFMWKLDNVTFSTTPELKTLALVPGEYELRLTHNDFLGRSYAYTGPVKVLAPDAYDQLMASIGTTNLVLIETDGSASYTFSTAGGTFVPVPGIGISVENGVFREEVVMNYRTSPVVDADGFLPAGIFYELDASYAANGRPVQLPRGARYEVTISYGQENIPAGVRETDLALYSRQGREWVRDESSIVDARANTISATPDHFSLWAVLAEEPLRVFLPAVRR